MYDGVLYGKIGGDRRNEKTRPGEESRFCSFIHSSYSHLEDLHQSKAAFILPNLQTHGAGNDVFYLVSRTFRNPVLMPVPAEIMAEERKREV